MLLLLFSMGTLFSKPKDPEEEAAEKLKLLTMNSQNSLLKGLDNFKRGLLIWIYFFCSFFFLF